MDNENIDLDDMPWAEWPHTLIEIQHAAQALEADDYKVFLTSPSKPKSTCFKFKGCHISVDEQATIIIRNHGENPTGLGLFTGYKNRIVALDFDRKWAENRQFLLDALLGLGIGENHYRFEHRSDNPGKVHLIFKIAKDGPEQDDEVFKSKDICEIDEAGEKQTVVEIKADHRLITTFPHAKTMYSYFIVKGTTQRIQDIIPISKVQWVTLVKTLEQKWDTYTPHMEKLAEERRAEALRAAQQRVAHVRPSLFD